MLALLAKHWWVFVLRGVLAIIFGILAYARPGLALTTLVMLFGAYSLADGIFSIISAISGRQHSDRWWVLLLEGIVGIVIGVLTFAAPGITTIGLLYYIAFWALLTGLLEIIAAIRLRKEIEGEWWLILSGIASIVLAAVLFFQPTVGALGLIWAIAFFAIFIGVMFVLLGLKLRGMRSKYAVA